MTQSERLEREADETRAELAATLQELRARMTPGQVVDQLVGYARDSGSGAFFRNLGRQVTDNPLPLTLMGASLAWLMIGGNRATTRAGEDGDGSALTEDMAAAGGRAAGALGDATNRTAAGMSEAAARIGDAATRATASVGGTAATVGRQVSARSRDLVDLCREQPLVLAGIGIAIGAAIGAMLPPTDAEDRLLGGSSDQLKARTRDIAAGAREAVRAEGPRATSDRGPDPLAAKMATASEHSNRGGPAPIAAKMATGSERRNEGGSDPIATETATASERPGGYGQAASRGGEPGGSA